MAPVITTLRRKMKFVIVVIIMAFSFYSCSSTVQLSSYSEANKKVRNGSAMLYMKTGQTYDGEKIQFGPESTWFINRDNDSLMQVKTQDLEYVYARHHTGGALEGLLIGGVIGAAGGLVGSMIQGSTASKNSGQLLVAILTGTFGSLIGLVFGAAKGHEYKFVLPQQDTSRASIQSQNIREN